MELADRGLRRMRMGSQLLHRPGGRGAGEVLRHLLGVQAQLLPAAGLALRARTTGLTAKKVDRARLEARSIVLTWAMRGTLHLVPADDLWWLVPLVLPGHASKSRYRLEQMGLRGDESDRAIRAIERMLGREGPLSRREIAERLERRGIRTAGQIIAHLTWLAAAERAICYGPDRGRTRRFVLARDWVGPPPATPGDRERALAELALRYLRAHGPATPIDLASWSGVPVGDARRGWGAVQDRLRRVETREGPMWSLRSSRLGEAPSGLVSLLPSFDEYVLGWKGRGFIADRREWAKVYPGGGWFQPIVTVDGRAAGTWSSERGRTVRVQVEPFAPLAATVRRKLSAEVDDLGAYLGTAAGLA